MPDSCSLLLSTVLAGLRTALVSTTFDFGPLAGVDYTLSAIAIELLALNVILLDPWSNHSEANL